MENTNPPKKFKLLLLSTDYNFMNINNKKLDKNNPFDLLISESSEEEIEKIIELKGKNIIYFYYIYKKEIENGIYNGKDELQCEIIIEQNFNANFHNYFYLALLIDNYDVMYYKYDKKIIDDFNQFASKGEFNDLIRAKIIQNLIKYFKDLGKTDEIEEKNLSEILQNYLDKLNSNDIKNKLEKYGLQYTSENIEDTELEVIYINIVINVLLKTEFIKENNEDNIEKIIKEIDLENIKLTESMLKEIAKFFENDEKTKYIISEENKEIIINFYYYLCKYILKESYYIIYQNEFLLELSVKIKDIIIKQNQKFLEGNKINKEKLQYIKDLFKINDKDIKKEETIEFNFYKKDYSKTTGINNLKTKEKSSDKDNKNESKTFSPQIDTSFQNMNQNEYINQIDDSNDLSFKDENYIYDLLIFKGNIMLDKNNNSNKTKQILELGNKYFVKLDTNNNIFIYSRNNVYEKLCFKENGNIHGLAKSNNEYFFVAIYLNEFIYLIYSEEDINLESVLK